ncbi:MAG TPA: hypothetical protein VF595_13515 [Tepidisphaeraceae bacterium]|jgi:hypothetical protein
MPERRHSIRLPAVTLAVAACALAWPRPATSETPASQPTTAAAPVVGPIAYFIDRCARCHGEINAPYLGLDKPKRGHAMEEAIAEMAAGPAQAPLEPDGLRQQVALHDAIFDKKPFVWLDPTRRDVIAGEVLPGTTLTFEGSKGTVTPLVKDNRFELPRQAGTLIGEREGQRLRLTIVSSGS